MDDYILDPDVEKALTNIVVVSKLCNFEIITEMSMMKLFIKQGLKVVLIGLHFKQNFLSHMEVFMMNLENVIHPIVLFKHHVVDKNEQINLLYQVIEYLI